MFPNGDVLTGDADNGLIAKGMYAFVNGDIYSGSINEKDQMHGEGVLKNKEGLLIREGTWEANQFMKGTAILYEKKFSNEKFKVYRGEVTFNKDLKIFIKEGKG